MQHNLTAATERRRAGFRRQLLTAFGTAAAILLTYAVFSATVDSHKAPAAKADASKTCPCQVPGRTQHQCLGSTGSASFYNAVIPCCATVAHPALLFALINPKHGSAKCFWALVPEISAKRGRQRSHTLYEVHWARGDDALLGALCMLLQALSVTS